jgi:membrane protease YdiL (CAAX protease family)
MHGLVQKRGGRVPSDVASAVNRSVGEYPNTVIVIAIFFCAYFLSFGLFHLFSDMTSMLGIDQYAIAVEAWQISMATLGALTLFVFPQLKKEFSFSISTSSVAIAIFAGLLGANVEAAVIRGTVGRVDFPSRNLYILILVGVVAPVVEELFMRGIVLNSFLRRHGAIASVLVSAILFAGCHDSFWGALVVQLILSVVFLAFKRSLTTSMIAHSTLNLVISFPSVLLLRALYVSHS